MREYVPSRRGVLVTVLVVALTVSTVGVAAGSGTFALSSTMESSSTNTMPAATSGTDAVRAASASSGIAATDEVQFVSASETASTSNDYEVDRPAGVQEGDLLILTIGGTSGDPLGQSDDGWTRIDICSQDDNGETTCEDDGEDLFLHMYYKVASSDEPAEYDVDARGNTVASVVALRGADTSDPIASVTPTVDDGDTADSICPSTGGVDGGMLLCGFTHDDRHELEDYGALTLRSEDFNGDSSTQVATKELNDGGDTDEHVVDHVDPTGNKDIMMAVTVRPDSGDGGSDDSSDDSRGSDGDDGDSGDDSSGEGVHVIDGSTIEADWQPDFEVRWENYVYFAYRINDGAWQYELMDEPSDNHFETTLGGLSDGDTIAYTFSYYDDGWQYTDGGTTTFQADGGGGSGDGGDAGASGPGTNKLVYGEGDALETGERLVSENGEYQLKLQGDGNLVLRDTATKDPLWASDTAGDDATRLTLQGDSNLVLYTDSDDPVWASDTVDSGANELVLEDDGALVLYDDGTAVWSVNDG